MQIRTCCIALALAHCALPVGWAVKLGESVPDAAVRDCSGAELRLSPYQRQKNAVILAEAADFVLSPSVLSETCRDLAALDTLVFRLSGDAAEIRRFLGTDPPATLLVDPLNMVRRLLPGRALTGPDLARFVKVWQFGRIVFNAECARCHGEDGAMGTCEDVKPLVGIGRRLTEAQIRERLRMAPVNDQYLIRSQFFTKEEVDSVIVYVAGL